MTAQLSNQDLVRVGGLSGGLAIVGVAIQIPLLTAFGGVGLLLVVGLAAVEGLLTTDESPTETTRDSQPGNQKPAVDHLIGPLAAIAIAGGMIVIGFVTQTKALTLSGALLGLAVTGGLATIGIRSSGEGPNQNERSDRTQ